MLAKSSTNNISVESAKPIVSNVAIPQPSNMATANILINTTIGTNNNGLD